MPPIVGNRIPVKLPWKGATRDEKQFVLMKEPVALWLKLSAAKILDLEYSTTAKKKDKPGDTAGSAGEVTVKRLRRPGFKQRSIRVSFGNTRTGTGSTSKIKANKKKVGNALVSSVQFPITKSTPIIEVVRYFATGAGKDLGVKKVVDVNTGASYSTDYVA